MDDIPKLDPSRGGTEESATVSVCLMGKMGFSVPSYEGFPHFTATDTVAQPPSKTARQHNYIRWKTEGSDF